MQINSLPAGGAVVVVENPGNAIHKTDICSQTLFYQTR